MKPLKRAHATTYDGLLSDVAHVIEAARHAAARSVNAVMTITYWLIGRRIIEQEQQGAARAGYGEALLKRLARDLSKRFGRGFSERNLEQMRAFYLGWPIPQTASAKLVDVSSKAVHSRFPLSWSHYARLLAVRNTHARSFYENEALRGGWNLKLGKLTHGDAGQMHLYLNYAREHWALPGENPPVGLILCAERDHAVAKYALEGLSSKVLAAEYRTTLPEERLLAEEIERTRRQLDAPRTGEPQSR